MIRLFMRLALIVLALGLVAAPITAVAQVTTTTTEQPGTATVVTVPAATPAATQNTVATTGPVTSTTTISVGTLAGQILNWIVAAFAAPIGSIIVWILVRVLKKLGIDATDALRARLQEMVVNGLNVSAKIAEKNLEGKGKVEIKNEVVQGAVEYVQAHGADTIKALGLDPQSGAAVAAITARIETAIADPTSPTPAIVAAEAAAPQGGKA